MTKPADPFTAAPGHDLSVTDTPSALAVHCTCGWEATATKVAAAADMYLLPDAAVRHYKEITGQET